VKKTPALLALAALLLLSSGLLFSARRAELVRAVEYRTLDWRFRHFSDPSRRDPRIVLVMLDQPSLDRFEADGVYWPWPRSLYAAALEFFKKAGAKAVVFDLLFTSPSPYGVSEDREFGKALKKAGMAVLAMETGMRDDPLRAALPPERFALEAAVDFGRPKGSVRLPVPELLSGAAFLGDTSSPPDSDGVFRRVPLVSGLKGRLYPSLSLAAALAANKAASLEDVPLSRGRMLVRFHGAALAPRFTRGRTTYASYSLGDVILSQQSLEEKMTPPLEPALFKDKIVGNIHLVDNYGYQDDHLSPGTGNAPIREFLSIVKKYGYDKAITIEPGADASTDISDFHGLMKTWRYLGSSIYGMGTPSVGRQSWGQVQYGYFGQNQPPYFIFGAYAPSNDWTLWSQTPLE